MGRHNKIPASVPGIESGLQQGYYDLLFYCSCFLQESRHLYAGRILCCAASASVIITHLDPLMNASVLCSEQYESIGSVSTKSYQPCCSFGTLPETLTE